MRDNTKKTTKDTPQPRLMTSNNTKTEAFYANVTKSSIVSSFPINIWIIHDAAYAEYDEEIRANKCKTKQTSSAPN